MSKQDNLRPGLPDHSLEAFGVTPPCPHEEDQHITAEAGRVVQSLQRGESWDVDPTLNAPGHRALLHGDAGPLQEALRRLRRGPVAPRHPFATPNKPNY